MDIPGSVSDSIPAASITFTPQTASKYISGLLEKSNLWRPYGDSMRLALGRLIDHYYEPFDSVSSRLSRFFYNPLRYRLIKHVNYKTIPIRWLNDSTFIIDTLAEFALPDNDSISVIPDSTQIVISDTTRAIAASEGSPFLIVPGENMADSLRMAVETILSYTSVRDSILIYFSDIHGQKTPFWLTSNNEDLYRYWVKNYKNDSITIWLGNPSKKDITLILEEDINVNRMQIEEAKDIPIYESRPARTLAKVQLLKEIPVYWNYDFASSLAVSQTYFSNWAKGGENSFTSVLDITGGAYYTNKEDKTKWTNSARLKFGTIITEKNGLRTNTDLLEFNSQYNKVIREKIDFSTVFYMKTQIAKGFNYPNDSIPVSKFLNPGTFTIGVGLEYKPFEKTTLNFSPLSYKNTFVLDTANIDQTLHGIAADRKVRQEMGSQFVIKSTNTLLNGLNITNSLRLFSSYLNKPQNIDVDWEINLDKQINWFFKVQLNIHMIYDDDIRFPVLDDNDQPVLLPDGKTKKSPKTQLKQYLGLTMSFKF